MYTIGYDIGSSSVKIALINTKSGKKIATLSEPSGEMEIQAPQSDWAEQDPEMWWTHMCNATNRLLKETQIDPSNISAIGISYQMHGLVIVDKKGVPLRKSIIWCDSRAVEIGNAAYKELGHQWCAENIRNAPGNFTASKLKWVKENEPDIYKEITYYMLPGDYIAFKLSGDINTTRNGLAEGTLWNYRTNSTATALLDHYGIDKKLTPPLVSNFKNQGFTTEKAARETGLVSGIPIRYRSGDQPNNALSLNILNPGEVAATGGTSGVIYAVTDQLDFNEISKVNHFAHVNYTDSSPTVGRLLNINGCGILYRWLKNTFGEDSYETMNAKAASIPIGSDNLLLLPYGNGAERMFNNLNVGAHLCNLNFNIHSTAHIYRSALEGIAFSFVYGMEILKEDHTQIDIIRAGNDNLFRSQLFSETVSTLIGQEIEIYDTTGAVGAARAASIIDGNFEQFGKSISENDYQKTYKPLPNKEEYKKAYENWKNQLELIIKNK